MKAFDERVSESMRCYPDLYDSRGRHNRDKRTELLKRDQGGGEMQPGGGCDGRFFTQHSDVAI